MEDVETVEDVETAEDSDTEANIAEEDDGIEVLEEEELREFEFEERNSRLILDKIVEEEIVEREQLEEDSEEPLETYETDRSTLFKEEPDETVSVSVSEATEDGRYITAELSATGEDEAADAIVDEEPSVMGTVEEETIPDDTVLQLLMTNAATLTEDAVKDRTLGTLVDDETENDSIAKIDVEGELPSETRGNNLEDVGSISTADQEPEGSNSVKIDGHRGTQSEESRRKEHQVNGETTSDVMDGSRTKFNEDGEEPEANGVEKVSENGEGENGEGENGEGERTTDRSCNGGVENYAEESNDSLLDEEIALQEGLLEVASTDESSMEESLILKNRLRRASAVDELISNDRKSLSDEMMRSSTVVEDPSNDFRLAGNRVAESISPELVPCVNTRIELAAEESVSIRPRVDSVEDVVAVLSRDDEKSIRKENSALRDSIAVDEEVWLTSDDTILEDVLEKNEDDVFEENSEQVGHRSTSGSDSELKFIFQENLFTGELVPIEEDESGEFNTRSLTDDQERFTSDYFSLNKFLDESEPPKSGADLQEPDRNDYNREETAGPQDVEEVIHHVGEDATAVDTENENSKAELSHFPDTAATDGTKEAARSNFLFNVDEDRVADDEAASSDEDIWRDLEKDFLQEEADEREQAAAKIQSIFNRRRRARHPGIYDYIIYHEFFI